MRRPLNNVSMRALSFDLKLNNIQILYKGGGTVAQAQLEPPEEEAKYPEPDMFGETPAYGFFIRHVKGLEMNNVDVRYMKDELRPAFVLDDVRKSIFRFVTAQHGRDIPTFLLKNVEDFSTYQSSVPDAKLGVSKGKKTL